jgi:DNA processing protein
MVAIVGTRNPSVEARAYAARLARNLAEQGVAIASGGALGIDTAAHEGALSAGGRTLVVAPSSLDRPYPLENAGLFARVVGEGGGFVSRFESNTPARNPQFFVRNSYLVALCNALVMVEAPLRSGARNAALWARRLQRPFFVVPATPWNPKGLGCIVELKLGARPLYSHRDVLDCLKQQNLHLIRPLARLPKAVPPVVSTEPEDNPTLEIETRVVQTVRAHLDAPRSRTRPEGRSASTNSVVDALDSAARAVLEAVASGAHHVDAICMRSGLPVAEVQTRLLTLTLLKALVAEPAGTYRLPHSGS